MSWLFFAFSGPILWAMGTHIDKYLIEKFFKKRQVAVLMIFTALMGVLVLPVIYFFHREVFSLDFKSIIAIVFSGMLYMMGMIFYLQALQSEEASVVAPFFETVPLFGYVLALIFLGEALTPAEISGGGLILAGTAILSWRLGVGPKKIKMHLAALMLLCAFLLAFSSLIFKFFAIQDMFWTTTFWSFVGEVLFGIILLFVPANRKELLAIMRVNRTAVLLINGFNELINLGGGIAARFAMLLAPLSLVQAIGGTTTLFVFAIGAVLSVFFPKFGREDLSARSLIQKGVATALVIMGVLIINYS